MAQGEAEGWKKEGNVSLEGFLKQDLNWPRKQVNME